jgi:hypothetical protein
VFNGVFLGTAHAQDSHAIQIEILDVQLLPEYEENSILVIWKMDLSGDTTLPRELMVKIPARAKIRSISSIEEDESPAPLDTEWEAITIGKWQNVRLTTTSHKVHIEYLDPNLIKDDNQRKYEFNWVSIYAVKTLSINVYQPTGINEMITFPSLLPESDETSPIPQYSGQFEEVSTNEIVTFTLSYSREENNPYYPKLDVLPAMPIDETTTGRSASPWNVILWLLAVAVSILVMVGLSFYWIRKNMLEKRERIYQGVGIINPEKQVIYCHECGMHSQSGDSYCRNCGTPLHQSTQRSRPPQA